MSASGCWMKLDEGDTACLQEVMGTVGSRTGAEQVLTQVDNGAVPIGELLPPRRHPKAKGQELTPVCCLGELGCEVEVEQQTA